MACAEQRKVNNEGQDDMEDEEELFEINLEAVNSIPPPPPHYWESYFFTATNGNALLANCLLSIDDLSNAVPMASRACNAFSVSGSSHVLIISERLMGFPSLGVLEFQFEGE